MTRYPITDTDGNMPDDGNAIVLDEDGTAYLWHDWAYHGTIDIGPNPTNLVGGYLTIID